jgi:DNA recombination protein RmuC
MEIVFLITGLIFGVAAAFIIAKYKFASSNISQNEFNQLRDELALVKTEKAKADERYLLVNGQNEKLSSEIEEERKTAMALNSSLSKLNADREHLEEKLALQKQELDELQKRFATEFENLANRIFEEKSKKFTDQNKTNIDDVLKPLGEKIKDFEKKVNDIYVNDSKERAAITQQIRQLHELNQQMSKDANNLTKALKGDSKLQGNWGEFILETILEKSGLERGREFIIQGNLKSQDGANLRPDVIINLPESKSMIIDSKVSLTAYEMFCSCEDETLKKKYLTDHINSLRTHIKSLSQKSYQNLYELQSLDFVLMFIPIEPALALAVQNDTDIFYDAFEKNIIIVSPSTLLATLRTIANIWKQEKQNKNALEIARQSGELYDKFAAFVDDLILVGNNMRTMKDNYEKAMNKLSTGRGNLVRRAEVIKELGAKTSKSFPNSLLERAKEDEELF